MDKSNADLDSSLESVREKLGVEPLTLQMPLGTGRDFAGIVDLVEKKCLLWDKNSAEDWGKRFRTENLDALPEALDKRRHELIEILCDFDENLAEFVIAEGGYDKIAPEMIHDAVRKVTLTPNSGFLPTFLGSAYKNIGVQPLMNAVVRYLPSPLDVRYPFLPAADDDLCCLAFKTTHRAAKDPLTFVRIYSGDLSQGDSVYNATNKCTEKIGKLSVATADDLKPVNRVECGNIAVLSGLKNTITGDTLFKSKSSAENSQLLSGICIPDPVVYASIEPASLRFQKPLERALGNLAKEDPSFRVSVDPDTDQTVLSGMGELHLEIILDRILKEQCIKD